MGMLLLSCMNWILSQNPAASPCATGRAGWRCQGSVARLQGPHELTLPYHCSLHQSPRAREGQACQGPGCCGNTTGAGCQPDQQLFHAGKGSRELPAWHVLQDRGHF